ncbi:hypothetical protein D3C84_1053520 [compost metagenome]
MNGAIDVCGYRCDRQIDGQVWMRHRRGMNDTVNTKLLDRADDPRDIEQLTLYSGHELRTGFGIIAVVTHNFDALFAERFS